MLRACSTSWVFALCTVLASLNGNAQVGAKADQAVAARIKSVETHLGGWVQTQDGAWWSLQERMSFYHVHGLSIAVVKNFRIDWAKGYGWADSAEHRPVSVHTLFQAGSISKSLNAVGVLKLVQTGRLNLYANINDYLRSWTFPYDSLSKGKKITMANLLSHTAGLSIHGFPGYAQGDSLPSLSQVLDGRRPANTAAVRSEFEPSLKFQYSGGGTTIAQLIVQDITGMPYADYMWKNVLQPMGMTSSSYQQPPAQDRRALRATAYYNNGEEVKGKYHIYPEQAAAGLWTNPTDLATYIIETQQSLLGRSQKVLSHDMTVLRLTPYIDSSAAFGVFIVKKGDARYFNHNGVDEGFVALYYGSMEGGNGVVVMANTYNTAILDEVANSVATVYGWKDFYQPVKKRIIPAPQALLSAYEGRYKIDQDTFAISKEKDGLLLIDGDNRMRVHFTSDADFFLYEANGLELHFRKNMDGSIEGIEFRRGSNLSLAKKLL